MSTILSAFSGFLGFPQGQTGMALWVTQQGGKGIYVRFDITKITTEKLHFKKYIFPIYIWNTYFPNIQCKSWNFIPHFSSDVLQIYDTKEGVSFIGIL